MPRLGAALEEAVPNAVGETVFGVAGPAGGLGPRGGQHQMAAVYGVVADELLAAPRPTPRSSRVSVVWTFARYDDRPAALPIQVVRLGAKLGGDNSAPGERILPMPVQAERNPCAPAASVKSLTVEASFDDGATWRRVPVDGFGDQRLALLSNPTSGHVSLRAHTVDSAGRTVEQTIIRAYRIR